MEKMEYFAEEICKAARTDELKEELMNCCRDVEETYGRYDGSQSPEDWIIDWMTDLEGGVEDVLNGNGITIDSDLCSKLYDIVSGYCYS